MTARTQAMSGDGLKPFYRTGPLSLDCPRCAAGGLLLVEGTFGTCPTPATKDAEEAGYLDPWEGEDRFACLLQCSNPTCQEIVACAGTMEQEQDWSSGHPNSRSKCRPTVFRPLDAARRREEADRAPFLPVCLDPTDEAILALLASESVRLTTPDIAAGLDRDPKSIGKSLSKLRRACLIENRPRLGYRITRTGRAQAPSHPEI